MSPAEPLTQSTTPPLTEAPHTPLTQEEIARLCALARRAVWAPEAVRRQIQAQNLHIVPASFYSTLPTLADIDASFETRAAGDEIYNGGLFDTASMSAFVDRMLPFAAEFDPPLDAGVDSRAFHWRNPAFSFSDAMAYYCMLRLFQPKRVVEVGSGYSTLVADLALRRNGQGTLTLVEPYPKPFLKSLPTLGTLIEKPVQDVPLAWLVNEIEGAGLWFIDSTHTVKAGSDCLWLYLRVMPELRSETIVHSHDIFLPFGFPPALMKERHIYWTEQYLLYAYLLKNPECEVLFSSPYAQARLPDAVAALMGGKYRGGGGSLWYRLNGRFSR